MEDENYSYQKDWKEYKRRQKTFWLCFLGFLPLAILPDAMFGAFFKVDVIAGLNIGILYTSILSIGCAVCLIRWQYWKCPRCGKPFHKSWWWNNMLARKCVHCKLPKYQGSTFYK